MKRNILWVLAWTYTITLFIATLPIAIGLCIYSAAANETFTNDPEPKYLTWFMGIITWPVDKLEKGKL